METGEFHNTMSDEAEACGGCFGVGGGTWGILEACRKIVWIRGARSA